MPKNCAKAVVGTWQKLWVNQTLSAAWLFSFSLAVYKNRGFAQLLQVLKPALTTIKNHTTPLLEITFPPYPHPLFKQL